MNKIFLSLFLVTCIFILPTSADTSDTREYVIENKEYQIILKNSDGGVMKYQFNIKNVSNKNSDFTVYLEPHHWRDNADVYISTKPNQEPDMTTEHKDTISCYRYGANICALPS